MVEPGSASVPTLGGFAGVLDLPLVHVGKVRELYAYGGPGGEPALLMVATDRISAFDFVLDRLVPDKGAVLTQLSQWWFAQLGDVVENHVRSTDVPDPVRGRAVVCERLDMVPVECVARGYLTGSGWVEYQQSRSVCGVPLPEGLVDGSRLPEPIFTPATKAAFGEHDENVDFATMVESTGQELGERLRDLTLAVYARAERIARDRGLVLADTKLEFGRRGDGTLVLADEVLTPDSSRYWDAATWEPGARLDAFDKQFVRNWLLHDSGWDREAGGPPPSVPADVVAATRERYLQAYERLTGSAYPAA
jgi:phosphoribosylaminoimidazole-succinocarboxamide synthase